MAYKVRYGDWLVSYCAAKYKENRWEAVRDDYDGPDHPGFVYGEEWGDVRDEIQEIGYRTKREQIA